MAATLQEILLTPDNRPKVVADCQTLIDQEVSDKSGISGTAIKLAYKTVTAFASGIIHDAVDTLLPDFVAKLEPYYADFVASGGSAFGDFLAKQGAEVSEALLSVTDARAAQSERAPIKKAYNTVRPSGVKNVEAALPRLGALIQKYTG
ncbi:MAG TPA: hypothetical protein VGS97_00020 [Actinocrinis sp.]|uniref:DUF6918 family protein n=1 Tax=Actinocrinis sp. TaxID=1920516 RepID=UPI002DDC97A2|nr:hypothetical protein [Actinocrinis sp.]HEV2342448.1 hypothetical protein [Actinocrinis sp.]